MNTDRAQGSLPAPMNARQAGLPAPMDAGQAGLPAPMDAGQAGRLKAQGSLQPPASPARRAARKPGRASLQPVRGQSMFEYLILIVAVTTALVFMTDYVRRSLNAFSKAVGTELVGAENENRP